MEPELIGFLIYRPDTQEFFRSGTFTTDRGLIGYAKEPAYAYQFQSNYAAYAVSFAISADTQILELYDLGDRLAVFFD